MTFLFLAALLTIQTPAAPSNPPATLQCAAGDDSDATKAPVLTVAAGAGHRLFVCAVNVKKKHHGALDLSGFRVFMVSKSGRKIAKPLFESDPDETVFRLEAKDGALKMDELISDGKVELPAFESILACDASGCHVSKPPKCVFTKLKPGSRRALDQLGEFQHGDKKGKVPPKSLIDSLAALAFSGDADAQAFFHDRGALALDGDSSDAYFDFQAGIERLKTAGCL